MKTIRKSFLVALAALVAALVLLSRQTRIAHAAEARLSGLAHMRASLGNDIEVLKSSERDLDRQMDVLAAVASAAKTEGPVDNRTRKIRTALSWLELKNGALYRKLGLTPAQIEQFEALDLAHWQRWSDTLRVAHLAGISQSDPALPLLWQQETAQYHSEELALIGPGATEQVQQYERAANVRPVVNGLAGIVYALGAPLSAEQGEQLTQIMASNSQSYQNGGSADLSDLDLDATFAQAQAVLSPAQFTAFEQSYLASQALGRLRQEIRDNLSNPPVTQRQSSTPGR